MHIFNQILILFLLLLVGFVARRLLILEAASIKGITSLVVKVTLPAMVIDSMVHKAFSFDVLVKSGIVLGISLLIYFFLIILSFPFARMLFSPEEDAGIYRFAFIFSNVGFMGYPVIQALYGERALFYTAIFNLPFNFLAFTLGIILLLKGRKGEGVRMEVRHFLNPVVVSVVIGFILFILEVPLPKAVTGSIATLGAVTSPLSMIIIGALLANSSTKNVFANWRLYALSLARLVIVPLLAFLVLRMFVKDELLVLVPAVISGMPVAANTALLAEEYGANANLASEAIFLTTLLSMASIPALAIVFSTW
jgi:hypothetical protein